MKDRKLMLEQFLKNDLFLQSTGISEEDAKSISFMTNSNDPLIEALKKLIFSYCQNDAQVTVIRNVNIAIENNI